MAPHPQSDSDYVAPAASRNAGPILSVLKEVLPKEGRALEIASGTGQHITVCAAQHPGLFWQPSDIDENRFEAIEHWIAENRCRNVAPPLRLDATRAPLPGAPYDVILLVNLMHLVSEEDCWAILTNAAAALRQGGLFCLYGPFLRESGFASEGDRAFHSHLQSIDPGIGYKHVHELRNWIASRGFIVDACREMPANNLMWILRKA